MTHFFHEDEPIFRSESPLKPVSTSDAAADDIDLDTADSSPSATKRPRKHTRGVSPSNVVLIRSLGPNYPELIRTEESFDSSSTSSSDRKSSTPTHMESTLLPGETVQAKCIESSIVDQASVPNVDVSKAQDDGPERALDADLLKDRARAAVAVTESEAETRPNTKDLASRVRVDSAQDGIPQLSSELRQSRQSALSPLKLQTQSGEQKLPPSDDTIATSPTLRKHVIPPAEDHANTLSALQPISPAQESRETLPSFRQVAGQLSELANVAAIQEREQPQSQAQQAQHSRHHSHSFSSTTSQSPRMPYFHTSPNGYFPGSARSPTSTIGESQHYQSPTQYPMSAAYYHDRRSSTATDHTISMPPSLHSASSSAESYGYASSSTDGYSTAHTTPIDQPAAADGTPRPILPPPHGMPHSSLVLATGYKCDEPGCTAVPFQTQYLLSSHKNVHSQNRPHYCPVQDCSRSEGGKGFKRKNEMIRHGLVHNSPGYICPFCPDREHRYPRPDNLQRHVRVHHVDKDRDNATLRDVLAQRNEGAGKARRRRTNGSIGGSGG